MTKIALSFGPCDLVVADIDDGFNDDIILKLLDIAKSINSKISESS